MDRLIGYRFRNLSKESAARIFSLAQVLLRGRGMPESLCAEPGEDKLMLLFPLCPIEKTFFEIHIGIYPPATNRINGYEASIAVIVNGDSKSWSALNRSFRRHEAKLNALLDDLCVLIEEHVSLDEVCERVS